MENADVFTGLQDFLQRMRQPSATDFVKSIKSFIVSFSNDERDPEKDSAAVQSFLAKMEVAFCVHPLWAGCSQEDLDNAIEGLEKYVMSKLFTHVFASAPDDVRLDNILHEKIALVQQFIQPENLDIKPAFQNETSWLLAQKELQKINTYKAPREKLMCILNCCKVIASSDNTQGADEFLPVLIYVTLKANPPQLHSNLLYIQRYRRQSRLVAEAAYYFTNMLSVESFISNLDANSLSMDESEFEKNIEFARAIVPGISTDLHSQPNQRGQPANIKKEPKELPSSSKVPSCSDLEDKGAAVLVNDKQASLVFQQYPFLFAHVGDLTVNDVEDLLNNYKQLVLKYVCLSKGLGDSAPSLPLNNSETKDHQQIKLAKKQLDHTSTGEPDDEPSKDTDTKDGGSNADSLFEVDSLESQL